MVRVAVCEFFSLVKRIASLPVPQFAAAAVAHQVTRVVVAGLLLAASLLKFWSIGAVGSGLAAGNALTGALATLELVAAVVLVVHRPSRILWTMYALGFVAFACISGYHAWSGAPNCGCFGNVAVSPIWTLALDLAVISALLGFPPTGFATAASAPPIAWGRRLACIIAFSSLAAIAGLGFKPTEYEVAPGVVERGDQLILTPTKWVGHPLPIEDLLDTHGEWLRTGEREVWIIDPGCRKCAQALAEQSRGVAITSSSDPRVLIILGANPLGDALNANQSMHTDVVVRLSTFRRVVCPVPTRLMCRNLVVVEAIAL